MPAIVVVRFTYSCSDDELARLARQYIEEVKPHVEGLVWKIFLHRPKDQQSGGVYLFKDQASAHAYAEGDFIQSLRQAPSVSDVSVGVFDTIPELSRQANAPL
jgi:hypothetical protein